MNEAAVEISIDGSQVKQVFVAVLLFVVYLDVTRVRIEPSPDAHAPLNKERLNPAECGRGDDLSDISRSQFAVLTAPRFAELIDCLSLSVNQMALHDYPCTRMKLLGTQVIRISRHNLIGDQVLIGILITVQRQVMIDAGKQQRCRIVADGVGHAMIDLSEKPLEPILRPRSRLIVTSSMTVESGFMPAAHSVDRPDLKLFLEVVKDERFGNALGDFVRDHLVHSKIRGLIQLNLILTQRQHVEAVARRNNREERLQVESWTHVDNLTEIEWQAPVTGPFFGNENREAIALIQPERRLRQPVRHAAQHRLCLCITYAGSFQISPHVLQ